MNNIDRLIGIKKKQLELLKEIKRNSRLQAKKYYVLRVDAQNYQLVLTEGNKLLMFDRLSRIVSHINLRGLADEVVFDEGVILSEEQNRKLYG